MTTDSRIESLETQVRTLKRMLFGVFGLVVVGGLLAATTLQSVPDVIQAKSFEVVNDAGKVIIELSNLKGGGVDNGMLVTRNSAGGTLVELGANTDGEGMVTTQNGKGGTLVKLSATPFGGAVRTENGKGGALVQLSASPGGGAVAIENGKGGTLAGLGAGPGGGLVITLDKEGKEVTSTTP
jgi:hypothetical protein